MTRPLIILGTGGAVYDVLDIVEGSSAWQVVGFLDDTKMVGSFHLRLPVLGRLRDAGSFPGHDFINAIGSDVSYAHRADMIARTGLDPVRFATLVHPTAAVSSRAKLGFGTCVNARAVVAGGVVVGAHVGVGVGVIIGHDSLVGDYSLLAPGAIVSGFVRLGRSCYVGAGATLRQRVEVGSEALVGLGAVVLQDVPSGFTVVGNPARRLRDRESNSRSPGGQLDFVRHDRADLPVPTMFPAAAEHDDGP